MHTIARLEWHVALLGLVLGLACAPMQSVRLPATTDKAGLPTDVPSISGQITVSTPALLHVEENPTDSAGSAKAAVRLTDSTRILKRGGGVASRAELVVGRRVSVWFTGPVAQSYPAQATAVVIVLESVAR